MLETARDSRLDRVRDQDRIRLGIRADYGTNHEAALERLTRKDVFALPSSYEGLPNALLEVMAGLPVVPTSVGSIPDVVRVGECDILVPGRDSRVLGAAVLGLLSCTDERSAVGLRTRSTITRNHDIGHVWIQYARVLTQRCQEAECAATVEID